MSGKAMAIKSLKEKWLSIVQSAEEKGEKGIGGPSTVTAFARELARLLQYDITLSTAYHPQMDGETERVN